MTQLQGEVVLLPFVVDREQPEYLLEAFTRGRYAAKVGFNTANPYRDDPQMAKAWQNGWESAERD